MYPVVVYNHFVLKLTLQNKGQTLKKKSFFLIYISWQNMRYRFTQSLAVPYNLHANIFTLKIALF